MDVFGTPMNRGKMHGVVGMRAIEPCFKGSFNSPAIQHHLQRQAPTRALSLCERCRRRLGHADPQDWPF